MWTNFVGCRVSPETSTLIDVLPGWEMPDLSSVSSYRRLAYLLLKRLLDLVVAPILLCIATPVILIACVLIRIESRGPAIFIQERVGARYRFKDGRIVWQICLFHCYKLRTMLSGADPSVHKEYLREFRNGYTEEVPGCAPFKLSGDPRVTRMGRLLRKTSLDELPQLWNVIKGDMSLVGPRPVPAYEVELYDSPHYARLTGRPGITGLWQVYGRSQVTFERMIEMDIDYVQRSSILFDIKLLLLTVTSVLSLRGAV
jgi:lipopolysaccharide/colanic/teichoic acid biosynthesis glycosyltransferase